MFHLNVANTLLLYILTILSLRRVSVLSFTSFLRRCAKSPEGYCVDLGAGPDNVLLPSLSPFLFTSTLLKTTGGLLTGCWESAETCWPFSSLSTQKRLATERGEMKERLDLFSLSLSEALSFGWCCGGDRKENDSQGKCMGKFWKLITKVPIKLTIMPGYIM